jgi:hypothetical protein
LDPWAPLLPGGSTSHRSQSRMGTRKSPGEGKVSGAGQELDKGQNGQNLQKLTGLGPWGNM